MGDSVLVVNHLLDNIDSKHFNVPINKTTTAEDVCIYVCKQLNISPLTRHLFALRTKKNVFAMPAAILDEKEGPVDFRIRFRVSNIMKLKKLDINAYNYYFHQARIDVWQNKIPEISYDKHKRELVGLGITDMYRVMLEKKISRETVVSEYKRYIPKEVLKKHGIFVKSPIRAHLQLLEKSVHEVSYVKAEYIRQLETIAPGYLSEKYKAVIDQEGSVCTVHLKVDNLEIKYSTDSNKNNWEVICTIEDLGFISIRNDDGTLEISRKNGIPFYLKFNSSVLMYSFISLVDGYYRLSCKWTFNICSEVYTPSLQKLALMKSHGPVGGEFSYEKLEAKTNNKKGCFILRECVSKFNDFYIDVCLKDGAKPTTFKLVKVLGDEYIFNNDLTRYKDIQQLMRAYKDPNGAIYLQECLPPSEYDVSPLLLCKSDKVFGDSSTGGSAVDPSMAGPVCINSKNLLVYKATEKEGSRGITMMVRVQWKKTPGKKVEGALKKLKPEYSDRHLKDFLTLAGQWVFLQSSAIVKLFGIAFTSNFSFVMEYFRLGPLDSYLRNNRSIIKEVDLIEAASNLASALWHLTEHDFVHGNIRCHKLMVNTHDENSFTVKLMDPGVATDYMSSEVHWIPVECYTNLNFARKSTEADVWSVGTTLWEIFMYGEEIKTVDHVEAMRGYAKGRRLPKPPNCTNEIYTLMKECWDIDPHKRKKPQAVMRDVNQILYQVYNSRRVHSYCKVFNKPGVQKHSGMSTISINSNDTESTILVESASGLIGPCDTSSEASETSSLAERQHDWMQELDPAYDWSNLRSFNISTATTSLDSLNSTQSVFELDDDYTVVLQGRIGQGFYGEVYKATMERVGEDTETKKVAVKKLKTNALPTCLQDFEREIHIMKSLHHPNIVEILGIFREESYLVMEFVPHGSLQSYLKIYKGILQENQLLKYALDIAKGMDYLGEKNIVHRDLATRNILVVDENHVKISDFGLAQVIGSNDYYILRTPNRELPIKWYAPESLKEGRFSKRSDVWSYGVTLCEMFNYGEEPNLPEFGDIEGTQQQILLTVLERGARFPCPPGCQNSVYVRIIYPCWNINTQGRPTFAKLVEEIEDMCNHFT